MSRTQTCPAPRAGGVNTTVRWALAACAIGMLIAAMFMP